MVLLIGNFLSSKAGIRGVCEDLSIRFQALGWKVYTTSNQQGRLFRLLDMVWTIWKYRKKYTIAVVEVYSGLAFVWAEVCTQLLSILHKKYILSLHGGKLPEFSLKNRGRIKKLLTSTTFVTSPSKYLIKTFHTIIPSIQYLPNGIALSDYPYHQRKKVNIEILWLRAFHSIYSPLTAIEVLQGISKDFPAATLTMIGPDKGDGTIQEVTRKIRDCSLEDNVIITGPIPKNKVGEFLARGDIFLNTTLYESFGISVLEAAACGLCIITTNVGELPYLWEDGVDALLVPPNNPQAMIAAVKRILEEPGLAERLSENARKKAEQYDWSVILPQWERMIDSIS